MKPRSRKILIALGALAVLVLAALLIAPRFIDADSFRPAIERMAREKLGRDVSLGELGVSFLPPSVTVADISVAGTKPEEPWIQAKGMRARASWSGLLSGNLEISGIALDAPVIRLLRAPDGRVNLVEMIGGGKKAPAERKVSVDDVSIRDGRVEFVDAFIRPGDVARVTLTDVNAKVSGLGSGGDLRVDASASVEGAGSAAYRGRIGKGGVLDGHASTKGLDVAALAPWMANRLNGASIEGIVTSDLQVKRSDAGTSAMGRVEVERFRLPSRSSVAGATAAADIDVSIAGGGRIDVRRFDLTTGATQASARGSVSDAPGEQVITLEIDAPKVVLRDVAALAAAVGQSLPLTSLDGERLSAKGSARIVRKGDPKELASVALDGVEVRGMRLGLRKESGGAWHLIGAAPPKPKQQRPLPLLVRDLRVSDTSIRLEDASVSPPAIVEIRDVTARVESWAPGEAGNVDVSATVASGKLSLKGRIAAPGAAAKPWDAKLNVSGMSLAQAGALASVAGLAPKAGTADWTATITGTPGTDLRAQGRLKLSGARLPLADGREITLDMPIQHDVTMLGEGRMRVDAIELGLPGGMLPLDGRLQSGPLRYDIGTKGPARLTPEAVSYLMALAGRAFPIALELSEPVTIDARARNAGSGLELSGTATLAKARVRHPVLDQPLDVARATVEMRGDRIEISDAALRLGASALEGGLVVEGFQSPSLSFDLRSSQADLDELFAIASRSRQQAPAAAGGSAAGAGPLSQRMRATGRLRVAQATFGGLQFSDFDSTVDMRDGRLRFDPSTVALYGGRGTGRLAIDLAGGPARFDADVSLDGVDARALLTAGMGYQDLSGTGRLVARLAGRAGSLAETLSTLQGEGSLDLADGEIGKLNALEALEKAAVFGERSLATLGGRLARDGTPFSSLSAQYVIADGRMRITRSTLLAPDADIDSKGQVTFATQGVDLDAIIAFSPELSRQMQDEGSRAAQIFWDARSGRVVLPAKIGGRVGDLKATIDWGSAASQIFRGGGLESILGGGRGSATAPAPGSSPQGETRREDPLGGLLGDILGGGRPSTSAPAASAPSGSDSSRSESRASSGGPGAVIEQAKMGGNFLQPDLRLRARLSGEGLSHAVVIVSTPDGREVTREERAFESDIAAAGSGATDVPVRLTVDSARLKGSGPFVVTVQAVDGRGRAGEVARAEVAKASPF